MSVFRSACVLFTSLVILVATDSSAATDKAIEAVTAFVHVAVIPMDRDRVLENWTVVVADGRIRELGPASTITIPKQATVLDGRGKYLMPGLIDMHAHTWEEEEFPLLLANGVTTIRNMFGGPIHLRLRLSQGLRSAFARSLRCPAP